MRNLAIVSLMVILSGAVCAATFMQENNPFPSQTSPESFNNIYETEPAFATKPMKPQKKSVFWKDKDVEKYTEEQSKKELPVYDGNNDSSFKLFKN